jgi:hypothetical protein
LEVETIAGLPPGQGRIAPASRGDARETFAATARTQPLTAGFLIGFVVLVGILTLPATPYGGDPAAWQAEAASILTRGELSVPISIATNLGEPGQFFVLNRKNGKYYSKYGTLNGILNVVPLLVGQLLGDEVVALGLFSVVLSGLIAFGLYDLTGYYTKAAWVRVAFVLLCFYTTYAWNYLRCTNSESTQWLFFLLAIRSLLRLNRAPEGHRHPLLEIAWMWLWIGCLCLTKVSWVLLMPLAAGALVHLARKERIPRLLWRGLAWRTIILPVAVISAIIAMNNWTKFGAPWLSGYHQWYEANLRVDFKAALYDLTLSPQWSLLICFPPILLAIPFWKRFWRRHKEEGIFILAVFIVYLLLNILRGNWRGEWCYGARYFLFIVPLLALPAVYMLEWADQRMRRPSGYLALGATLAACCWLVGVQWQVNRLDWFFKYKAEGGLTSLKDPQVREYFDSTHFAKINWDFWRARDDFARIPYYDRIRGGLSQEQMEEFVSDTRSLLSHPNLYWWSRRGNTATASSPAYKQSL